jgi:hypothetical protein
MKKTFAILLLLLVNYSAFSQWSTNPAINNAICTNYYTQNLMQITTEIKQTQKNELRLKVSINHLGEGMYFIQVSDGETVQKGRFIKH